MLAVVHQGRVYPFSGRIPGLILNPSFKGKSSKNGLFTVRLTVRGHALASCVSILESYSASHSVVNVLRFCQLMSDIVSYWLQSV